MWARVSGSIRDCCASHLVRARGSLAGDGLVGRVVRDLRRISGFRNRLLHYHSMVNYTSLGYGDVIMSPSWKLLGPLETANGMLLFGVSTAMIFAVIQRLIQARFVDLKE